MAINQIHRRQFLGGLVSLVAAPAIVRIENIMPVRAIIVPTNAELWGEAIRQWHAETLDRLQAKMAENMERFLHGGTTEPTAIIERALRGLVASPRARASTFPGARHLLRSGDGEGQ